MLLIMRCENVTDNKQLFAFNFDFQDIPNIQDIIQSTIMFHFNDSYKITLNMGKQRSMKVAHT